MHKRFHFLFFLILIIGTNPHLFPQNKSEQHIATLEHRRFEAMTHQDIPFLQNVLAENVTYAHSNGLVETKNQHLENIRSGSINYQEMELEENSTRFYKKTAITIGIINVKGLYKGNPFSVRLGYTDVYVKMKGKWKLVAWRSAKLE